MYKLDNMLVIYHALMVWIRVSVTLRVL